MTRILERQEKQQAKGVVEKTSCPNCYLASPLTPITAGRCMNCGWQGVRRDKRCLS